MANMSYCRFRNTLSDFRDCCDALEEEGFSGLTPEEVQAAIALVHLAARLTDSFYDEARELQKTRRRPRREE